MNPVRCEREPELIAALRSNSLSAEHTAHIAHCSHCAQAVQIARILTRHAATLQQKGIPPAAGRVWRRAQAQRQQAALRRATLSLVIMRLIGSVYVLALAAWSLRGYLRSHALQLLPQATSLGNPSVLAGVGVALLVIAAGVAAMLLAGKPITTPAASS